MFCFHVELIFLTIDFIQVNLIMTWYSIFSLWPFCKTFEWSRWVAIWNSWLIVSQWSWYHFGLIFNIQCLTFFQRKPPALEGPGSSFSKTWPTHWSIPSGSIREGWAAPWSRRDWPLWGLALICCATSARLLPNNVQMWVGFCLGANIKFPCPSWSSSELHV